MTKQLGRCYISGPITGKDYEQTAQRFAACAASLTRRGYQPVNPMMNELPATATWEAHLAADIMLLMRCHAIYMQTGWHESHGARLEHELAKRLGLQIIYEEGKA